MTPTPLPDQGLAEVADRVWVARHAWLDVNLTVVGGERGLVVVDTLGSERAARRLFDDLRALHPQGVVAVVNTHEHGDHTLGNAAVRQEWAGVPIHAQEEAAARTREAAERAQDSSDGPHADEVRESRVTPADHVFSSVGFVDLGDRLVELVHPGRGHTGGDLVVRVPDADVVLAGDLVEESGPPGYGDDSYPLEWPATLDFVVGLLTGESVVVPGHGAVVDKSFVEDQRGDVAQVAETIHELVNRMVPVGEALAAARWPFPVESLEQAVRRGYAQVPRAERRLPLA